MQTGVAFDQQRKPETPKDSRVGINIALVDHGSLARLLVAKGVFTEEEYFEALVEGMRREVDRYTDIITSSFGAGRVPIKLR